MVVLVLLKPSLAASTTVRVPITVGLPVMRPVAGSMLKPAGSPLNSSSLSANSPIEPGAEQ
jgi:hypothetical protein